MNKEDTIILDFVLDEVNEFNWKAIAIVLEKQSRKVFKLAIGDNEPSVGFRETIPVIQSEEELKVYLKELIR